jgi:hypothetical protein
LCVVTTIAANLEIGTMMILLLPSWTRTERRPMSMITPRIAPPRMAIAGSQVARRAAASATAERNDWLTPLD